MGFLAGLATVGTLPVWMFYAWLLYANRRRNERPMVLIHQANVFSPHPTCLIVNLSREAIHILSIGAVLHFHDRHIILRITEYDRVVDGRTAGGQIGETTMKEGPLKPGDFLALGNLNQLLQLEVEKSEKEPRRRSMGHIDIADLLRAEIRVIAHYSTYDQPVAASRNYSVRPVEGELVLEPETLSTRQLVNKRDRRLARRWLEEVSRYS